MKKILLAVAIFAFPLTSMALTMEQLYNQVPITKPKSPSTFNAGIAPTPAAVTENMLELRNGNDVITRILSFANVAIYVLVSAGVVFIVYHVVRYIIAGENPDEKTKHLGNVGWGLIGLFVIVSLWGLVNILVNTFKTSTNNQPNLPNADFIHNGQGGNGSGE